MVRVIHAEHNIQSIFFLKVKIKDYNARIDEQNVFDQSVKNGLRANDSVPNITGDQGDDYTTSCLVDYPFF